MKPLLTRVFSAHVMGRCGMAGRPEQGVVRPDGTHWQVPELSVYGLAARLATGLANSHTGRDVRRA